MYEAGRSGVPESRRLCAKKLRTLPLAIRRRAAVFILETEAGGADYAACEALLHLLTLPSGSITVQGGAVLSVRRDRLYREAAKEIPPFCTPLLLRGETQVCGKILRAEIVSRDVYAAYQKIYKNLLYLALDYDTIRGKLILAAKAERRSIRPCSPRRHTHPEKAVCRGGTFCGPEDRSASALGRRADRRRMGLWNRPEKCGCAGDETYSFHL